jgi:hypothetical protein
MNLPYYWGPLLYKTKIENEDIKKLLHICNKNNNFNKGLAGHLKNQFLINVKDYVLIIQKYFNNYKNTFEEFYPKKILRSFICNNAWVNYMQAGDFNPTHVHTECDVSSVIFLKIPNELLEEAKNYEGTLGLEGAPGCITFIYGEEQIFSNTLKSFFPQEGDFFIFPANLRHTVSPFKSNLERISTAANFIFNSNEHIAK